MNDNPPKVSIGLPVYNGERFLVDALDSLLAQSLADFELIISDNGSSDSTQDICRAYAAKDGRIRYLRNEKNRGAAWNFNRVFALASGQYFKWAAHDDLCEQDFLLKCVEVLDQDRSVVLSYPQAIRIDEQGQIIKKHRDGLNADSPRVHVRFRNLICVNHSCLPAYGVIRTETLEKTPLIGNYTSSDRVLLAELGLRGRFVEVSEELFFFREHPLRSTRALPRHQDRVPWFDPQRTNEIVFPKWRLLREYIGAIKRVPLARVDRLLCLLQLTRWLRNHHKAMVGDLGVAVNQLSHRLPLLHGRSVFFR